MQIDAKLLDSSSSSKPWNPLEVLPVYEQSLAQYSTGFLRMNLTEFFNNFSDFWKLLEHSLSLKVQLVSVIPQFNFPDNLTRVIPIEIGREPAVIAMDDESQRLVSNSVVGGAEGVAADVILEYFERRFLSCLNKSWQSSPHEAHYLGDSQPAEVDIISVVSFNYTLNSKPCSLWFGLGPKTLAFLDKVWKDEIQKSENSLLSLGSESSCLISLDLAYLAIEPAMLIDYMRSGSVISLGPVDDFEVFLSSGSERFAKGKLVNCESQFAIEIGSLKKEPFLAKENNTFVLVQLGESSVDVSKVKEFCQEGAIYHSDINVVDKVRLIVSGEVVANAILGTIDNNFVLTVLPR